MEKKIVTQLANTVNILCIFYINNLPFFLNHILFFQTDESNS